MTYKLFVCSLLLSIFVGIAGCEKADSLQTTSSGLQYEVLQGGKGDPIGSGVIAEVHYTGWLLDGTKFDSSKDRNTPFTFPVGKGAVIRGRDEGVAAMRVGEIRKLTIPPELAYGDRGAGNIIPPGSTLIFEVELLGRK